MGMTPKEAMAGVLNKSGDLSADSDQTDNDSLRTSEVRCALTPYEHDVLTKACKDDGMSKSTFVRRLIRIELGLARTGRR